MRDNRGVSSANDQPDQLPESVTETASDEVTVRRAPRYPRFLGLGLLLGGVVALILTFSFPPNDEFDRGQVFGFLLLLCATGGLVLGAVFALILDRAFTRRARRVQVEHESTRPAPQNDLD